MKYVLKKIKENQNDIIVDYSKINMNDIENIKCNNEVDKLIKNKYDVVMTRFPYIRILRKK